MTRAHLLAMKRALRVGASIEDMVTWTAALTAFHFFCRASEYCATLADGSFDVSRVLRRCDVIFLRGGQQIHESLMEADEVQVTFGKTKTSAGGETRAQHRADHELCVVSALAAMCSRRTYSHPEEPLFSWPQGSRRPGRGVRYVDMMTLVKDAGVALGEDPKDYGTHSYRRGGATAYMTAGVAYERVRIFGRWKSDCARRYIEPWAGMMAEAAHLVARGHVDAAVQPRGEVRAQVAFESRARMEAQRLIWRMRQQRQ